MAQDASNGLIDPKEKRFEISESIMGFEKPADCTLRDGRQTETRHKLFL